MCIKKSLYSTVVLTMFTCLFLNSSSLFVHTSYAEQYKLIPSVIHIHTTIGNGENTPEEIVELARKRGIKVVIFTEHDTMKWTYGVPPLRTIIQKVVDQNSIQKYGAANYINTIEELNKKYPDMVLLHGAESIPFYYWKGSYFKKNLALVKGNEHILVLGLENPSDYEKLPSVGNGFPLVLNIESIFRLWPVCFFIFGWCLISLGKSTLSTKNEDSGSKEPGKILAIVCFFVGTVFLVNNFPFKSPLFDQYHGDQGVWPYQYLIDHADNHDALTFWAHPEVEKAMEQEGINIISSSYEEDLLNTFDYTGIAVFSEGMRSVGPPGGIWDKLLLQYCAGMRQRPVWAIGEVDYKGHGFDIAETQTVFLIKEKSYENIMYALATGKMYAAMGDANKLTLNSFVVEDTSSDKLAFMGDDIELTGKPRIRIVVTVDKTDKSSAYNKRGFKIDLIRNGTVIKTFEADDSIDIAYDDDYYSPGEKIYYRLAVDTSYLFRGIVTNPVFVTFKEEEKQ